MGHATASFDGTTKAWRRPNPDDENPPPAPAPGRCAPGSASASPEESGSDLTINLPAVRLSIGDVIDNLPFSRKYYLALTATMFGFLFDAFDTQVMALALPNVTDAWHLSSSSGGLVGSAALWGMGAGALCFGFISDLFGRRIVMMITVLGIALFTGLSALAQNVDQLIALRFLTGIFMGAMIPIDLTYLAEISPAKYRGRIMATIGVTWPLGQIAAALVAAAILPHGGWRWLFVVGIAPAFVALWIRRQVPESPRWLAKKGRYEEAVAAARKLGSSIDSVEDIDTTTEDDKPEARKSLRAFGVLFQARYLVRTIGTSIGFFIFQAVNYGWAVWVPTLLVEMVGYPIQKAIGAVIVIYAASLLGRLFFTATAERLPRRLAQTLAFLLMGLAALAMTMLLGLDVKTGWVFVMVMVIFQFANDTQPMQVWVSELFPTEVRGLGSSFASTIGRVGAGTAPIVFGALMDHGHLSWVFYAIAIMTLVGIGVTRFILKTETVGRSLASVDAV